MSNKIIYPYGVGGQTSSGVDIVDYTTGGNDKAASAESVKELAQYVFMGSGTFAEAYDKAKTTLAYFPWLLEDTDKEGNVVKKMIWHVGNKKFIDAIGAEIDGVKNGITVVSEEEGYMRIWTTNMYQNHYVDFPISEGETNYSFEELDRTSGYNVEFVNSSKNALLRTKIKSIDFGGFTIKYSDYNDSETPHGGITSYINVLHGYSGLTTIKRLNVDATIGNPQSIGWFSSCSNLEYIQVSGQLKTNTGGGYNTLQSWLQDCPKLQEVDFSGFTVQARGYMDFFSASSKMTRLDIRGFDFVNTTSIKNFIRGAALKTIIVGNIDTTNVTTSTGFMGQSDTTVTNATLVVTQDTPPSWNIDFINGHITSIKVPNKTIDVEVEGTSTPTAVADLYKAATGWSTYASIITTYNEGEY